MPSSELHIDVEQLSDRAEAHNECRWCGCTNNVGSRMPAYERALKTGALKLSEKAPPGMVLNRYNQSWWGDVQSFSSCCCYSQAWDSREASTVVLPSTRLSQSHVKHVFSNVFTLPHRCVHAGRPNARHSLSALSCTPRLLQPMPRGVLKFNTFVLRHVCTAAGDAMHVIRQL